MQSIQILTLNHLPFLSISKTDAAYLRIRLWFVLFFSSSFLFLFFLLFPFALWFVGQHLCPLLGGVKIRFFFLSVQREKWERKNTYIHPHPHTLVRIGTSKLLTHIRQRIILSRKEKKKRTQLWAKKKNLLF